MRAIRRGIPFFLLAFACTLMDELIQVWLRSVLQPSEARMSGFFCHPLLRFNPDFAWGLLSLPLDRLVPVSIGLAVFMATGLVLLLLRTRGVAAVGVSLLLGAVLNGCLDRLRYGSVVDFMVCQSRSGLAVTFNVGDVLAVFALLLLAGKAFATTIRRRRISKDNIPRDDSGTV